MQDDITLHDKTPAVFRPRRDPWFSRDRLTVLLVEADRDLSHSIAERLRLDGGDDLEVFQVDRLSAALLGTVETRVDAVLLDLSLPDSQGLESAITMVRGARAVPVIVLAEPSDEAIAAQALRYGVQGYVNKRRAAEADLLRMLRQAIERHRVCLPVELRGREAALERARLIALVTESLDASLLLDGSGQIVAGNRAAAVLLGNGSETLAGRRLHVPVALGAGRTLSLHTRRNLDLDVEVQVPRRIWGTESYALVRLRETATRRPQPAPTYARLAVPRRASAAT